MERRHTKPGLPTPAAGMMPPRGFPVSLVHPARPFTATAMLSESDTSHCQNRADAPSCLTRAPPSSSFMSRMAALPPLLQISRTHALPRPDALQPGANRHQSANGVEHVIILNSRGGQHSPAGHNKRSPFDLHGVLGGPGINMDETLNPGWFRGHPLQIITWWTQVTSRKSRAQLMVNPRCGFALQIAPAAVAVPRFADACSGWCMLQLWLVG